jgi:hypothetical protein
VVVDAFKPGERAFTSVRTPVVVVGVQGVVHDERTAV